MTVFVIKEPNSICNGASGFEDNVYISSSFIGDDKINEENICCEIEVFNRIFKLPAFQYTL